MSTPNQNQNNGTQGTPEPAPAGGQANVSTSTGTPAGTPEPSPAVQTPAPFDPNTVKFNAVTHSYNTEGLTIPEAQQDGINQVLNRFGQMGLSQEHAFEILSMGMKPETAPLSPQERLEAELSYETKMNYGNIVNFSNNLGLDPEHLSDPSKVTLIEEMMSKVNGMTYSGNQQKVSDIPTTGADVKALTPDEAKSEYMKFVTESDGFTTAERHAKMDELINLSTDKELTRTILEIYR